MNNDFTVSQLINNPTILSSSDKSQAIGKNCGHYIKLVNPLDQSQPALKITQSVQEIYLEIDFTAVSQNSEKDFDLKPNLSSFSTEKLKKLVESQDNIFLSSQSEELDTDNEFVFEEFEDKNLQEDDTNFPESKIEVLIESNEINEINRQEELDLLVPKLTQFIEVGLKASKIYGNTDEIARCVKVVLKEEFINSKIQQSEDLFPADKFESIMKKIHDRLWKEEIIHKIGENGEKILLSREEYKLIRKYLVASVVKNLLASDLLKTKEKETPKDSSTKENPDLYSITIHSFNQISNISEFADDDPQFELLLYKTLSKMTDIEEIIRKKVIEEKDESIKEEKYWIKRHNAEYKQIISEEKKAMTIKSDNMFHVLNNSFKLSKINR